MKVPMMTVASGRTTDATAYRGLDGLTAALPNVSDDHGLAVLHQYPRQGGALVARVDPITAARWMPQVVQPLGDVLEGVALAGRRKLD
jgi:hypothetical protein